jgi:2,3-bisphosphoglycerate-independent phosphoglycerate mutase
MAERLKAALSLPEGPGVEDAMYAAATVAPGVVAPLVVENWIEAVAPFHKESIDDQFMPPVVRVDASGKPIGTVQEGDTLIYWDFRTDRAKPLTSAFINIPFAGQVGGLTDKAPVRPNIHMCTMTHYDDSYSTCSCLSEAFNPAAPLNETYAEVIGAAGVKQLVVAESEKWRAVTWCLLLCACASVMW